MRDFADVIRFSERYGPAEKDTVPNEWLTLVLEPSPNVMVIFNHPSTGAFVATVWARCPAAAKKQMAELRQRYKLKRKKARHVSNFSVITIANGALGTRTIDVKPALRNDADVELHYGANFIRWQTGFISQLKSRSCGVTILRGEPGTGKTSFLKYLTKKLRRTHRFYYLPLPAFPWLSNPAAVDFWLNENMIYGKFRKVVILEDAESLLMQRGADNKDAVTDLLNVSDGFLGDVLRMHIICTINCNVDRIDPALMRPGRLVTIREFIRLSPVDASTLAKAKDLPYDFEREYSLAELYNDEQIVPRSASARLGF